MIGPGNNKDSSKAALVRRGAEAFGGRVVMVGDRCFDIEGGQANGVDAIGVCYGYGTEDELIAARATHIAHDVAELENILTGDAPRARGVRSSPWRAWTAAAKTTQRAALTGHLQKARLAGDADARTGRRRGGPKDPRAGARPDEQGDAQRERRPIHAPAAQNVRAVVRRRSFAATRGGVRSVCRFLRGSSGRGRQLGMEEVAALNAMAVGRKLRRRSPCTCACPPTRRSPAGSVHPKPDRPERQKADFFSRTGVRRMSGSCRAGKARDDGQAARASSGDGEDA